MAAQNLALSVAAAKEAVLSRLETDRLEVDKNQDAVYAMVQVLKKIHFSQITSALSLDGPTMCAARQSSRWNRRRQIVRPPAADSVVDVRCFVDNEPCDAKPGVCCQDKHLALVMAEGDAGESDARLDYATALIKLRLRPVKGEDTSGCEQAVREIKGVSHAAGCVCA